MNTRRRSKLPKLKVSFRLMTIGLFLLFAAIALIGRMWFLQISDHRNFLKDKANEKQIVDVRPFASRLPIVDRNGVVLAIDKPVYDVYAYPRTFKPKFSPRAIASQIAPIIQEDVNSLEKRLDITGVVTIKKGISETIANQIRQVRVPIPDDRGKLVNTPIDGLDIIKQPQRFYPQQDLASEVIGYVNTDQVGKAGVELTYEEVLKRSSSTYQVRRDGNGRLRPDQLPEGMINVDGRKLQLTIDESLQRQARSNLKAALQKFRAKRGTVLVMDVRNGELPVLVTEPNFDPNKFFNYNENNKKAVHLRNWAVSDLFEPGSTFKPLNVAIALQTGAIQPNQVFYDQGSMIIGGWQVANFDYEYRGGVGSLTVSEILERSSNVGMVHIAQQMTPATFYQGLQSLGLGKISGIDLFPEQASLIKPKNIFLEQVIEPATASFGQGIALSPIQLLQMQSILASGGKMLRPHVVRGMINKKGETEPIYFGEKDGKWQALPAPPPLPQILRPEVTKQVLKMMTSVVEEGTGKPARIPGYRYGGKTGTAQKSENGVYIKAKITSFVGIFPADNPRYVVLAVVDEPIGDNAYGSTVAAPIVKSVIESLIVEDDIKPTHPQEITPLKSAQT